MFVLIRDKQDKEKAAFADQKSTEALDYTRLQTKFKAAGTKASYTPTGGVWL